MPWLVLLIAATAVGVFFASKSAAHEPPLPTPKFRVGDVVVVSSAGLTLPGLPALSQTGAIVAVRFDTPGKVTYDVNVLGGGVSIPAVPEENVSFPPRSP